MKRRVMAWLALAASVMLLGGCDEERISEEWIAKQAKKYLAGRSDIDDTVRQSILAGKITVGMFPDEAVAAGGPFKYIITTEDGGTMVSVADIRFYFEYEKIKPKSRGIPPDILWMQREGPMTNVTITLIFWNRTQWDTEDFVNTRVSFEAGCVTSIERSTGYRHPWLDAVDCAALIERVKQEARADEETDSGKNETLRAYLSLLEHLQETQTLEWENANKHLIYAAGLGYLDVVEALLAACKNRYASDEALERASQRGHLDVVRALIAAGAGKGSTGDRALWYAATNGHLDVVKELLAAGADATRCNDLMRRAADIDIAIIKELVAAGVNIEAKDNSGDTALRHAAVWGYMETVEALLTVGADINALSKNGSTALMDLSQYDNAGHTEKAIRLVALGADINIQDNKGMTALMYATFRKPELVKAMLATGTANLEIKDHEGRTALIVAADEGNSMATEILTALITAGAKVNARDKKGRTALMAMLEREEAEWVKMKRAEVLVSAGSDITIKDNKGRTAEDYVKRIKLITPGTKDPYGKISVETRDKLLTLLRPPVPQQ